MKATDEIKNKRISCIIILNIYIKSHVCGHPSSPCYSVVQFIQIREMHCPEIIIEQTTGFREEGTLTFEQTVVCYPYN